MLFQSIVLAAGNPESDYRKCNFQIDENCNLLEFAARAFASAKNSVIALNPYDYEYFIHQKLDGSPNLVNIVRPTQGALATSGMCLDFLAEDLPIVVSAIDGICLGIMENFLVKMSELDADGGVVIFPSENSNYSYVRISHGIPIEFAEKVRIGEKATAGIFYFKNKTLLLEAIEWAILNQVKYDNIYYLSSAMNKFVFEGKSVGLFETSEDNYYRFSTKDAALESRDRMRKSFG